MTGMTQEMELKLRALAGNERIILAAPIATAFLSTLAKRKAVSATLKALSVAAGAFAIRFYARSTVSGLASHMEQSLSVNSIFLTDTPAPRLGGWALSAGALNHLIDEIDRRGGKASIVELGPGASSIVLATRFPEIQISGLEHDQQYYARLKSELEARNLGYNLILAPLSSDGDGEWYEATSLDALPGRIDILVVDGPPNGNQQGARARALPRLAERLTLGAYILIDDTTRRDERNMVERWIKQGLVELCQDSGSFMTVRVTKAGRCPSDSQAK